MIWYMKTICIYNEGYEHITLGKEYLIVEITRTLYRIVNDRKQVCYYSKNCFMTKEEHRDKKLKELGI